MAMRMDVNLQQRLEQRMHLSQQMLQNLELLQLPIMDLREIILQELEENPTLEEKHDGEEPVETTRKDAEEQAAAEDEEAAKREMLEAVEDQWSESERRTRRSDTAEDAERRMEMYNNYCQESTSLREHLSRQLALLEIEPGLRPFCDHVIENIDDAGYVKTSIEEMVTSLPAELRDEAPELLGKKIERAVALVQTLEPRGVGARSITECLLLQLDEGNPEYPLLRKLIENHFEDVGANRLPRIVKAFLADPETLALLGHQGEPDPAVVLEDVKSLIASMSRLNPRPGSTFSSDRVPKVYPEVVIKQVDGKYEIVLEDGWLPPISVNRNYEEMVRERKLSAEEKERMGAMGRDPKWTREERDLWAELARGKRIMPGDRVKIAETLKSERPAEEERPLLADLARDPAFNKDDRDFIKRKMEAGRKLITAIEQRRGTIYRITSEILKRQMDFFEKGVENLKPLKMQEVADAVGIHLSTVSRAISEKWVETPRGVFPLKFFFASAAPRAEAAPPSPFGASPPPAGAAPAEEGPPDDQTRLALMQKIREIVDGEDRKNPLSDHDIVNLLKDRHRVTAARRTVAKYREELGIASSRIRKQY
jgi:RNA polymerase sigma-54 factor